MGEPTPAEDHEPGLSAVELLCERLGEIGLPIGAATAREILRAVLALEAPRMEAHIREALQTSLDTIRIAAQSASGVLASTEPVHTRPESRGPPKPVLDPPARKAAATPTPRPGSNRKPVKRSSDPGLDDGLDGERRPVFRRPRGR
jgi:hypothetical protein